MQGEHFEKWLMEVFFGLDDMKDERGRIKGFVANTCWMIWKGRCEALVGERDLNIQGVIH